MFADANFMKIVIYIVLAIVIIVLIICYFSNPFDLPRVCKKIDISGKRRPVAYDELIIDWIRTELIYQGTNVEDLYKRRIKSWNRFCKNYLNRIIVIGRSRKQELYLDMKSNLKHYRKDYPMFKFIFYRTYSRSPYYVEEYALVLTTNQMIELSKHIRAPKYMRQDFCVNDDNQSIYSNYNDDVKQYFEQKKERAKMTNKLRFMVLKRDGYCCRLCGKSANDGAILEVDHRVPIKHGGKTELDNLWTLCFECNRGKGTDYI